MKAVFSLIFLFCLLHLSQGEEQEGPGESDQVAIGQEALPSLNREERSAEPKRKKKCRGKGKGSNCKRRANRKASRKGAKTEKCNPGKKGKKCRRRAKASRKKSGRKCGGKSGKKCRRRAKGSRKKKCNKNGKCGREYPESTTSTTTYAPDTTTSTTTTKATQTCYDCDVIGYGKDASLARTQVNKGKRIPKLLNRVEDRANKSATVFAEVIDALKAATENGTNCNGTAIPANSTVTTILSTLQNCSTTVPKICNASSVNTTVNCNITVVEEFGEQYKKCLFPGAGGEATPAYVCTCLGKLTPLDRPGCIPSGFDAAEKAAKNLNSACNKASNPGSWGDCRWAMKAAQPYLIGGSMQCQAPPTSATSTTTAASAGRRNQLLRNQFRGFLKHN